MPRGRSKITKKGDTQAKRLKPWEAYEEVARYVLQQLGEKLGLADVEGKQKIPGRNTNWEIDAKGIRDSDGATLLVECRRHTASRLTQEDVASVAFRIIDTGAAGGIIVSPLDLQKGAAAVAKNNKIEHVKMDSQSTQERWTARIAKMLIEGVTHSTTVKATVSVQMTVIDADGNVRCHK